MVVDISDAVTYTNFGDDRLRGFWVAGGQISASPIDFHRRPYNTLALPCERVITREHVDLNLPSVKIDHTKLEHLNADQKDALLKLVDEFADVFVFRRVHRRFGQSCNKRRSIVHCGRP